MECCCFDSIFCVLQILHVPKFAFITSTILLTSSTMCKKQSNVLSIVVRQGAIEGGIEGRGTELVMRSGVERSTETE